VQAQVREQLPFAPTVRAGPGEDSGRSSLRTAWEVAYLQAARTMTFGGKAYPIYNERGRPIPPQTFVDFVFDTWERSAGSWYKPMGRASANGPFSPEPLRLVGSMSIGALRLKERRTGLELARSAQHHEQFFEVWSVPAADRIPYNTRAKFFAMMTKYVEAFQRGDVLVMARRGDTGRGISPAMLIIETDPFTGTPSLVALNAGTPAVQTLEGAMKAWGAWALTDRIRPQPGWLSNAVLSGSERQRP
jgi:hypothetical protein